MKFIYLLLLGTGIAGLHAQTSVNAGGSKVSGGGGSVSYTVGQLFYTTDAGTGGSVIQGIQQAFEISVVSSLDPAENIYLTASAHPNPAVDYLTLVVKTADLSNLRYQLFDSTGKLLQSERITSSETTIRMVHLLPLTYFVKVIQRNKMVKLLKIIKL